MYKFIKEKKKVFFFLRFWPFVFMLFHNVILKYMWIISMLYVLPTNVYKYMLNLTIIAMLSNIDGF